MSFSRLVLVLIFAFSASCIGAARPAGALQNTGMMSSALADQPMSSAGRADGSFAEAVDLTAFGRVAVHTEGRVKSYDSFAAGMMRQITGPRDVDGQSPSFTYLDMMLRPERYRATPSVFVKNKLLRAEIVRALSAGVDAQVARTRAAHPGGFSDDQELALRAELNERLGRFQKVGLATPAMIRDPRVSEVLRSLSADLIRTAKFVDQVRTAMSLQDPVGLRARLKLVPTPGGSASNPWFTLDELSNLSASPHLSSMNVELRDQLVDQWLTLTQSWRAGDAEAVSAASNRLADLLPQVNAEPGVYPDTSKLSWESWYFRNKNMTWVWLIYALSLIPLLLFVVFRWPAARWIGLLLFLAAFGFHTFAVMLRWYVSGRWPNSNMFEAVTTAAWFGGCFAVLFELFARRSPVRGLLALGSAAASMVALMCAYYMPLSLSADIGNMMPVLHDVWLYIHTNVIIFSYCLIFMASISAAIYLLVRLARWMQGGSGVDDYARVGGAGSLIMTTPEGGSYLARAKTTLGQVLDGTTMILIELSFILLWAGIVMGAIWADHSWGRPWGWDPKEVFALNTFIIFALLIHTRLKVRDKGLWTAILAVIGCGVMLFNWIVINFTISGLHSYA
jgi:cytochrome c-type biogenesis protein CcsB